MTARTGLAVRVWSLVVADGLNDDRPDNDTAHDCTVGPDDGTAVVPAVPKQERA
jgi:hypothetical protein